MITAMIVDDEPIIRKGILTAIDWEGIGVNWIGEACNGSDALNKFKIYKPDVVITDIKMPIIDGVQLSMELRNCLPHIKIVFLSGHDDFEYLRHAIKIAATDYLLKPVNVNLLVDMMKRLKEEIEKETLIAIQKKYEEQLLSDNLLPLRFNLLNSFLSKQISKVEFIEKSKSLKINVLEADYQILQFSIDGYYRLIEKGKKEIDLLKYTLANISEEILGKVCNATACDGGDDLLVLILSKALPIASGINYLKKIQFYIKKYYHFSITVGIGEIVDDLGKLQQSYTQSKIAIENRIIKGNSQIITYDIMDSNSYLDIKLFLEESEERCLKEMYELLNQDEILVFLDEMLKKYLYNQKLDRDTMEQLAMNIIAIPIKELQQNNISPLVVLDKDYYFYNEIHKYETIEEVERWIKNIFSKSLAAIEDRKNNKYKSVVVKGMSYAKKHYDKNIQVSQVAAYVFVSPNYFSKVFKSETGENFTEWLNKYRVEKAKVKMVEKPKMKIYEIAEKVGFQDYRYFSYIFKKYTGLTSNAYREKFGKQMQS